MIVPTPIPFSDVPVAGVLTYSGAQWILKVNATTSVDLGNGNLNTNVAPSDKVVYFPTATLAFG